MSLRAVVTEVTVIAFTVFRSQYSLIHLAMEVLKNDPFMTKSQIFVTILITL